MAAARRSQGLDMRSFRAEPFGEKSVGTMSSVFRAAGGRIATPPTTDEYGYTSQTSVLQREAADRAKLAAKAEGRRLQQERLFDPALRGKAVREPGILQLFCFNLAFL
jgi:hypothetical protein